MKTVKLTNGKIHLAENNQSEREKIFNQFSDLFENNEELKDTEINIQLNPGHYRNQTKSETVTSTSTGNCWTGIRKTNSNRTFRVNKGCRRRLLRISGIDNGEKR